MKPQTVDSYSVLSQVTEAQSSHSLAWPVKQGLGGGRLSKYLAHLLKPAQDTSYSFEPTVEVSQGSPSVCCTSTTPGFAQYKANLFPVDKSQFVSPYSVHMVVEARYSNDCLAKQHSQAEHLTKVGVGVISSFSVFSHHRTPTYACHNSRPWLTSGRPILHGWALVM